ncbi:MAG: alanine--tRNA ligase, partial [Gammaproteobacteria bacterium]
MKSADIREKFLQFFESRGHARAPSSPLVPANDPTLLFTNSGMVQFKDVFLGFDKRPYNTAATAQRCLRAGGKHNDLQNVGYTARHHTFFEMLGNFSFGAYFKEKAIPLAWEFLTSPEYLGIAKEHLWVTVFGGGKIFGADAPAVAADEDAAALWKAELIKAGFNEAEAENRIARIPTTDNFWMMGETGPCGPCSEIFYDRDGGAKTFRGEDEKYADECVEIWNLVFMEFNRNAAGVLKKLPAPCVDTGMGLERISAVMQNAKSNYETDSFFALLAEVNDAVKNAGGKDCGGKYAPSHRVVADHIRAAAFLIADGVLPGNEGRGYVLRKIIRRGLIHGGKAAQKNNFGASPWFCNLAGALPDIMGSAGDILRGKREEIKEVLEREESGFYKNFLDGRAHLAKKIKAEQKRLGISADKSGKPPKTLPVFSGEAAFELYDTYGFPAEATEDYIREDKYFSGIDMEAFEKCMNEQRARSRAAMKFNIGQNAAEYGGAATEFTGYETLRGEAEIAAIFVNGCAVQESRAGEEALLVLNRTPFYAESGGQTGDAGALRKNGAAAEVRDTQKIRADVWGHAAQITEGAFVAGDKVECEVDAPRRANIARCHSATHLLHAALRQVLGAHVRQKGSLVAPAYLRFDFAHGGAPTEKQLRETEDIVNAQIRANAEVLIETMKYDEAIRRGVTALFGEKYGDVVRVVAIDSGFSAELCGGTHVARAGDIGFFQIASEGAVAAGVRRIEAECAAAAVLRAQNAAAQLRQIGGIVKTPPDRAAEKISQMRDSLKDAQKQIAAMQRAQNAAQTRDLISLAENINGAKVLIAQIPGADAAALREAAAQLRGELPQAALFLAGDGGGSASFAASGAGGISAKEWMNAAAK